MCHMYMIRHVRHLVTWGRVIISELTHSAFFDLKVRKSSLFIYLQNKVTLGTLRIACNSY